MRPRRGFSLIEAAIVLGLIGLVIGGIWAAASAVQNRKKIADALELLAFSHETALNFKKTTISASTNLGKILALKAMPGGYQAATGLSNGTLTNGRQWFYTEIISNSGSPIFYGTFMFNTNSVSTFPMETKPDLCLAVSTRLLQAPMGVPSGGYHSLVWADVNGNNIVNWDHGSAAPDATTLTGHCSQAAWIDFYWYL